MNPNQTLPLRAALLSIMILLIALGIWHLATLPAAGTATATAALTAEQIEYQKLLGKDPGVAKANNGFPTLAQMGTTIVANLAHPFYDNGPNDKGIAIQLGQPLPDEKLGAYPKFTVMGKTFDAAKPDEYLKSFAISKSA